MTHAIHSIRYRRGMTLVELTITMTIAGLLTLIAAPSMRTALRRHALEDATQRLTSELVRAQSEAIKLNRPVTVKRVGHTGYRVDNGDTQLLPNSVRFITTAPDSVRFASFGPPLSGATTFTLQWEGNTRAITVNAAGRVTR